MTDPESPPELLRVEYRVKQVDRFIVTKYEEWNDGRANSSHLGEYASGDMAWEVGYALCKQSHEMIGWAPGDERIQYPRHPMQPEPVPNGLRA